MQLSSGDWVAIAIGGIGIAKWCIEKAANWFNLDNTKAHADEMALIQLRSDFEVHKAEDRKDIDYIKECIARIDRNIQQLQSQMRNVAQGTNSKLVKMSDEDG